ncbi:MAG: hypothetical protein ACI3ZF_01580 [Candidatus Cryptobacteroides sp.]
MKKIKNLLWALCALLSLGLVSCSKDQLSDVAFYTIDLDYKINSGADVSAIDHALGDRYTKHFTTEQEARSEWKAFIDAVDDEAVVFADSESYCKFSLVLKDVKGENFVTVKVLDSIDWDQSGRHQPSIHLSCWWPDLWL